MARKKTPQDRVEVRGSLALRLLEIRQEIFGEHGGPELARRLNLPARTWYNYERGITVPAETLLDFMEQTGANPTWLLHGEGPRYQETFADQRRELTPVELIRRGLEELERSAGGSVVVGREDHGHGKSQFVAIDLYPLSEVGRPNLDSSRADGHVLAYHQWLPHPLQTIATRLTDDAMYPILPAGSIVAVDRSVTDPAPLHGQIVAACPEGVPMIRWLDVCRSHIILRPNHNVSQEHPLIPVKSDDHARVIIGQVVWSWSRFAQT